MSRKKPTLEKLTDDELLRLRICDLELRLEETEINLYVKKLYRDLSDKGLPLRPTVYFGDEWFSPEGVTAISVPFYLAHPRLRELEQKIMSEVEGGSRESCLQLLRHESGHCFDHAFKFSKQKHWKKVFGSPKIEYKPESYSTKPYSKRFVNHIPNHYAQAHPDEDFAETFAVWLTPHINWKKAYADWPIVLKKLKFIDELSKQAIVKYNKKPHCIAPVTAKDMPFSASRMRTTLRSYYQKRKQMYADQYPDYFDTDLRSIFSAKTGSPVSSFLMKNKKFYSEVVHQWTGERKVVIESLIEKLSNRANILNLKVESQDQKTLSWFAMVLTSFISNYRYTGKYKPSKKI